MAALPYMQFYVADYLSDTMHLSAQEHGAYLLLIMNYWQRGKALPNDDRRLSLIARLSSDEWLQMRDSIMEYFVVDGDKLKHPRLEADLEAVQQKQDQAAEAGKASARARRQRQEAKERAKTAAKETEKQQKDQQKENEKQTDVITEEVTERPAEDQRKSNHTDPDTDPDTRSLVAAKSGNVDNSVDNESFSGDVTQAAKRLANHLSKKLITHLPESKPKPEKWVSDIEKALAIDGRTEKTMRTVIDWIYTTKAGRFWIPSIQSGRKLREHFDQLYSRMVEEGNKKLSVPQDNNGLEDFARANNLRQPNPGESFTDYRRYLVIEVEKQNRGGK